jgi:sarcosine oxidase subunit gamma
MSEPVTALTAAHFEGGIAVISEVPLQGMITLRGDLGSAAVKKAAKGFGVDLPEVRQARFEAEKGIAWMSPDELLLLCPYAAVRETIATLEAALREAHALVVNVSDARASFRVDGPLAREVMGKLCPVDLSPAAFQPGMFRRTRMAQVPAAIWMPEAQSFQVICFRSQAQYVFDLLKVAAQPGSEVNLAGGGA